MIFNSFSFLVFFVILFLLIYFPLKEKVKAQNGLLLLSSYFFYGCADWMIIPLLLSATVVFFFLGITIPKSKKKKASLLAIFGVLLGAGLLLYFKYLNFFIESFSELFNSIGINTNWSTFSIILPLGISFFTFRLISYVVEIQRGKIEPTTDFVVFATYVAFFPTILSGPIDRPNNFIPQLKVKRRFNYVLAVDGCRQILWGMFQKVVIADNLAGIVNGVWDDIPSHSGAILLIIAILYSFQLYTDFSGYSHVAIGLGKVLGFKITKNFNYPYFSRNIAEFWRNWHMSLTSWLTDYIFIPLNVNFRNLGNLGIILAIVVNMFVVGLWHGAKWTFVVFGLFHGLLFIPLIISKKIFKKKKLNANKFGLPTLSDLIKMIGTFLLWTVSLIIFKAENIGEALLFVYGFLDFNDFFNIRGGNLGGLQTILPLIIIMFFVEWIQRARDFPLQINDKFNSKILRIALYWVLIILIVINNGEEQEFIYFQF